MMPIASCIPSPFLLHVMIRLPCLFCATCQLSMHLYMLAHMSMHKSCLLVCRPRFNTMKLWTFDPNLHLSLADTIFCFLSCLFAFLLVYLLSYLFAFSLVCLHPCFYACHVYHAYCFMPLSYALCIFAFHYLSVGFLSLSLHVHTWSEDAWSQGTVSQAQAKEVQARACRYKPSGGSQQVQEFSLSHLVMYSFKPLSFLLPFSPRWFVLGISCCVPFVIISRVWRPLFTFLHLYFRPCSRDVGIYFPALCTCIVHDVCIYIPAHPLSSVIVTVCVT